MSRTGDLFLLQDIDTRNDRDQARLQETEAAIAADPELDRLRTVARRMRRDVVRADAEVERQNAVVEGLRRRTRELDRHLYDGSVHNPQDLLGMQHELDTLRAHVAEEDERLLALMEEAETATNVERDAVAAVVLREQDRAGGAARLIEEALAIRAALEQHARDRAALLETLGATDVALYERLRPRVRPAVVRLVGDSCGGCHLPLANSEVRAVRGGDTLVQCSGCDRLVVS